MYINGDYFLLQSIIGLFLQLPYTCQTKLAKPNSCMYIYSDYLLLKSIICMFLLLPSTCQTKLSKPNPCMHINPDHFLIAVHHWPVPSAALHLPNQTPACILTQAISYCSPSLACSCCCPIPALPNQTPPCILTQTISFCSPSLA